MSHKYFCLINIKLVNVNSFFNNFLTRVIIEKIKKIFLIKGLFKLSPY